MGVAIVTGGSSGIGRHACFQFAEKGYDMVVADVRKDPREGGPRTHEKLKSEGHSARFWETDVREWEDVEELVEKTLDWYGSVDVMVNNAGFAERAPIEELDLEDARKIFRINVEGVYHGMRAVIPDMKEKGSGSIVNISSVSGKRGRAELAAYCGSKFAVIGMTESVAEEVKGHGIKVNAVCPGTTQTAMTSFRGGPVEKVAEKIVEVAEADYTGEAVDA